MALLQNDIGTAQNWCEHALRRTRDSLCQVEPALSVVFLIGGLLARIKQDHQQALEFFEEAVACVERSDVRPPAILRYQQGAALVRLGEIGQGEILLRRNVAEALHEGEKYGALASLGELGMIALLRANHEQALADFRDALALATDLGEMLEMSYWLMALAAVAAAEGRLPQVASLLGTADTLCGRSGVPLTLPEYLKLQGLAAALDVPRLLATTRASLGQLAFEVAWQAGVVRPLADIILDPFETAEAD
jgi:tetratricopeptide (TPR) repeat protein